MYQIIKEVKLGKEYTSTAKTKHFRWGGEIKEIAALQIVQILPDKGYYLIYFAKDGNELTDTLHASIELAYEQAEFEFNVKATDWNDPS